MTPIAPIETRLRLRIDTLLDRCERLELERDQAHQRADDAIIRAGKWYQQAADARRSRDMWKRRCGAKVKDRLEAA